MLVYWFGCPHNMPKLLKNIWENIYCLFKSLRIKFSLRLYLSIFRHLTSLCLCSSIFPKNNQNYFHIMHQPLFTCYFEVMPSKHFICCKVMLFYKCSVLIDVDVLQIFFNVFQKFSKCKWASHPHNPDSTRLAAFGHLLCKKMMCPN